MTLCCTAIIDRFAPDHSGPQRFAIAMPTPEEMDEMFMHTAQRCGGIEPLLESFFGFLKRRTDFYVVHDGKENTRYEAGFGPGKAEAMVRGAFGKHALKPLKGSDIERSAEAARRGCEASMIERADRRARKPPPPPVPAKPTASGADGQFDGVRYNDEGQQIPVGNGGVAEFYTWTQTLAETTVTVDAPPGTRSKDVKCKITAGRISLRIAGVDDVLEGELYDKIKDDDSMWTLDHADDGRAAVVLTFEKTRETWWRSVLKDAPKRDMIDATQVDSSKKIDEYDEKTQGAIRKIMFDQRQKQKGEKTSDEMKMDAILDDARNLPGSPFMDPASTFHNAPNPKLQGA